MTRTTHTGQMPVCPTQISGRYFDVAAVCATAEADTAEIDVQGFAFGTVSIPNNSSVTTITYYAANNIGATAFALYDEDGVAVAQTVAEDRVYALPAAIAGTKILVPVVNAAGTLNFHFGR